MNIYDRIRMLRIAHGMSQDELAKKVGYVGRSAISKVENGDRDISQSMISKYANALGVSPAFLLYGDEDSSGDTGNKRTEELLELFRQLTEDQQIMIIASIKGILSNSRQDGERT